MDLNDFAHAIMRGVSRAAFKELSRSTMNVVEREAYAACEEKLRKLRKEAKRLMKLEEEKAEAAQAELWDTIARSRGYPSNDEAIKLGIAFHIDGDEPEDEDEPDEREIVVYDTKPDSKPKAPTSGRFTLPN